MSKHWRNYISEGNVAGAKAYQQRLRQGFGPFPVPLIADAECDLLKLVDDLIKEGVKFKFPEIVQTLSASIYGSNKRRALNTIKLMFYLLSREDRDDVMIMTAFSPEWSPEPYLEPLFPFMEANRGDIITILAELQGRIHLVKSEPIKAFLERAFGLDEVPIIITEAIQKAAFNRRKHLLLANSRKTSAWGGRRKTRKTLKRRRR